MNRFGEHSTLLHLFHFALIMSVSVSTIYCSRIRHYDFLPG